MLTVYLGYRDARGREHHHTVPADGIPLLDIYHQLIHPLSADAACADGPPAWVAAAADDQLYADALALLLATHYGCEARHPDDVPALA